MCVRVERVTFSTSAHTSLASIAHLFIWLATHHPTLALNSPTHPPWPNLQAPRACAGQLACARRQRVYSVEQHNQEATAREGDLGPALPLGGVWVAQEDGLQVVMCVHTCVHTSPHVRCVAETLSCTAH